MKLPLLAALAALTFWGCANNSETTRPDDTAQTDTAGTGGAGQSSAQSPSMEQQESGETPLEAGNVVDNEREDRQGAPTVYDGEATGGSGTDTRVTTEDGEKWDVLEEPGGNNEPRTEETRKDDGTGGSGESSGDEGDDGRR